MTKRLCKKDFFKNNVIITNHAFQRWNERIGKIDTKEDIAKIIKSYVCKSEGVVVMFEDFYCIGRDIICYLKHNKNNIVVVTVYGEVSKNPMLRNIKDLVKGVHKYGKAYL